VGSESAPFIPFAKPDIGEDEIAEVVACLRSGWITTGPRCARFEEEFRALTGAKHALAFTSCTAALHVGLLALGVGPGDEVIVPPLTWPATANMVVATGAVPVFADVDPETWNVTAAAVAKALTPRTRVVLPVHYAGLPVDLDAIRGALTDAGRADVRVFEDAAHAVGAAYKGTPIGACTTNGSAMVCFSFHPNKNMTTGEGAILTTDDDDLARKVRLWRFHGVERDAWKAYSGTNRPSTSYDVVLPGFKYNLTDIQAAIGIHQLKRLASFNARRAEIAAIYDAGLEGVPGLKLHSRRTAYAATHAFHLYPVLVPRGSRPAFIEAMRALEVGTGLHFEAVHLATWYREKLGCREGTFPVAEDVCARVVSLPIHTKMTDQDARRVVEAVREALTRVASPR